MVLCMAAAASPMGYWTIWVGFPSSFRRNLFFPSMRIMEWFYCGIFFKHYKRILQHSEILDLPPAEVLSDIDCYERTNSKRLTC